MSGKYVAVATLFCLTWSVNPARAIAQQAQGGTPSPSGPTMEQTIAFLNEIEAKYTPFSYHFAGLPPEQQSRQPVNLSAPCTLGFPNDFYEPLLDVSRTNPLAVSVSQMPHAEPPVYRVELEAAAVRVKPLGDKEQKARTQVPAPGPIPISRNGDGIQRGVVTERTDASFTYFVGHDKYVVIPFSDIHIAQEMQAGQLIKGNISDLEVGDVVVVTHAATEGGFIPDWFNVDFLTPKEGAKKIQPASFDDRQAADRYAKALIHALVLCHKDEKPSLF